MTKWLWLAAYIGTVWGANWALGKWGIVDIGFGLTAPAGVYFAGLAFTCRDMVRESLGRRWMVAGILIGAGLSFTLEHSQKFALASGAAFLISESLDAAVYEPLRDRWATAVVASNVVGFTVDSVIFLLLAFGSLAHIEGQLVGKAYMTLAVLPFLWTWRNRDLFVRLRTAD